MPPVLALRVSVPLRTPPVLGVKTTLIEQLAPAPRVPVQVLLLTTNSEALVFVKASVLVGRSPVF